MTPQSPLLLLVATFRAVLLRPRQFFVSLGREPWFPAFDYALLSSAVLSVLITLFWNMGKFYLSPRAPLMAVMYFVLNLFLNLLVIKVMASLMNRVCRFFSGIDDNRFAYQATAYVYGLMAFWPVTFGLSAVWGYLIYLDAMRRHYQLTILEVLVAWLLAAMLLAGFLLVCGFLIWVPFAMLMTVLGIIPGA